MNVAVTPEALAAQPQAAQAPVTPAPAAAPAPASQSAPATPPEKPPYPPAAPVPTQEAPLGIKYDFNFGCRAVLPKGEHPWKVRLTDLDTGNILFETTFEQGSFSSTKRYYIRFRIEVWQQDKEILSHEYNAKDREVCIQFPVGTLGDTMGWFPYAAKFQEMHGCKLTCAMAEKLIPLFAKTYPEITFIGHEEVKPETLLRHLQHRPVLRRQGLRLPALRLPLCRPASHRRLHPGRRSDRGAAPARLRGRHAADQGAVCLHRHAKHDAVEVLEQSRGLARRSCSSSRTPAIASSASTRSRRMAPAWYGTTFPTAPRTRPAIARSRNGRAG